MATNNVKNLEYNVSYPNGKEVNYIPINNMGTVDGKVLNELDVINEAIAIDKIKENKHITKVYLMSPPGLGKTTMARWFASQNDCPYQVINCVSNMNDVDLLGSYVLIGAETVWQDGPLPSIIKATNDHAKKYPNKEIHGVLIINELNVLRMSAQVALNPLMDLQQQVILTQKNNEVIQVHDDAHMLIIASMNPDILGVNELQDSVRDRTNFIIKLDYPSVEKESKIVSELTGLDEAITMKFVEIINECRRLKTEDYSISKVPSTRAVIDWIHYSKAWGVEIAFELCVVNKYSTNEDEAKAIRKIKMGKKIQNIILPKKFSPKKRAKKELFVNTQINSAKTTTRISKISEAYNK